MGIDIILYYTLSQSVHCSQIVLGRGRPLFGSKSVLFDRSFIVLWNTYSSFGVHSTYKKLGTGIPLFRKRSPFTQCGGVIT